MIFRKLISISSEKQHSKKLNIQHVNNKITGNAFFLIYFRFICFFDDTNITNFQHTNALTIEKNNFYSSLTF